MTTAPAHDLASRSCASGLAASESKACLRNNCRKALTLLATAIWLAPLILAQSLPQVTGVDPSSAKVNDSVTVSGENLGKASLSGIFLSDDKSDYKATIVTQDADKIVIKVPAVKPGIYNVSIQVADKIMILPVRLTVEE